MPSAKITAVALLSAIATATALPSLSRRAPDPPRAIPQSANADELKFQPVLDYDTDSCYNVPAIDAQGNVCQGLDNTYTTNTKDCRDASDLDNQNVYSRKRCNNGWCAYMYEHYFEKDVGLQHVAGVASGHRHEWENVVIWVQNGQNSPSYIAVSQHDGYEIKDAKDVRFQDQHAKVVYNKAGAGTHDFRFANEGDDHPVENDKHVWIQGALLGYNSWPSTGLRDKMIANWANTGIKCKLGDNVFAGYLSKAIGNRIPQFDVNKDE